MRIRSTVIAFVIASLLGSSSAFAQQRHVVEPTGLRQAVADQALIDSHNREAVLNVLHRSDVRDLAKSLGLDVTRAENAVPTLNSNELAQLAGPAQMASLQLAGGSDRIVISMTTLLLLLILVILITR